MKTNDPCTQIDILGTSYPIKCHADELASLKESARYLEDKMKKIREHSKGFGIEKIAVITALNVVHEFLNIDHIVNKRSEYVQEKIQELNLKIDAALMNHKQLELDPAE